MVSCSDYDDDINSLTGRVEALEKTVADLKTAIESGSVITNVQSTENGVTVTLSDGKTFELKNGANGADGVDGVDGTPGSVITIGDNGNWFIDGVDTGKPSRGEKGEQGEQGPAGQDGKDGCWYMPGEDGYWHKQYYNEDGTVADEITDNKWTDTIKKGVVCVVYDTVNGYLQISNAEGMKEGQIINIPITSNLKSLAVIPYVLDKETNYPLVFFYNIMGLDAQNGGTKLEVATSTNAKAHYRLNPANANTQDWTWTMIDRTVTRAAGDQNELLSIASTERSNDEFIVTLKSNKSVEDLKNYNKHAIAALQGTNEETAEVITSDYIKVACKDLKNFSIVTGAGDLVASMNELPKINSGVHEDADVRMLYTESLDLNTVVKTWAKDAQPTSIPTLLDDMLDEGELTYQFVLPAEYNLGGNQTNQQDFVTLDGSVLKVNTEKWPNGTGAIGTTPIVEVTAIINGKIITTGVLKVGIVEEDAVIKPDYVVTVDPVNMEYNDIKVNGVVNQFTWEDMRKVYDALGITREEFLNNYGEINPLSGNLELNYTITDENGTEAVYNFVNGAGLYNWTDGTETEHTNAIEMIFNPAQIASNATGTMKITYIPNDPYAYSPIIIKFPYTITHAHEYYPKFDTNYVKDGVASVRGKAVGGVWVLSTEMREHFENIDAYQPENNHGFPYLVIRDNGARFNVELTGDNLTNQTATLKSLIAGDHLDVAVDIVERLVNGEEYCLSTYTIRFINPFKVIPTAITLDTPIGGAADKEAISFKIVENKENGATLCSWDGLKKAYKFETAATQYLLTADKISVEYREGVNNSAWFEEFGKNNNHIQKLQLQEIDGVYYVTWDNGGTSLLETQGTTYTMDVTVTNVAQMRVDGNVTINKTVQ